MEKVTSVQNFCLSILVLKEMNALEKFTQVKTDSCLGVQTAKHRAKVFRLPEGQVTRSGETQWFDGSIHLGTVKVLRSNND